MADSTTVPRFYVYVLARPDGKPFYVGKGSGARVFAHDSEARRGHDCYKCRVIRKIWKTGGQVQRYIVFETDDEQEAYAYERDLIAMHGRKALTNATDGGIGGSGYHLAPDMYAAAVARLLARAADPVERAKISAGQRARFARPGEREKHSAAAKRRYSNPDERRKTSERQKARFSDPAIRAEAVARLASSRSRLKVGKARARLTPAQAQEIRALYATGQYTQEQIGQRYGVHKSTIRNIIIRKARAYDTD